MRLLVVSAALAAAFFLTPAAAGYAPALSQDFSITNKVEPPNPGHRDLMRQLQAWWDTHAFYPRHASNSDEGGTVKLHLDILPDGRIWTAVVVGSSGSDSLDAAAGSTFDKAFVQPFPAGTPETGIDISLHYVLAHRHDQPVAASYMPVLSKRPFTITNDPVESPILSTMLLKTCTGTVVRAGIRNHPIYGSHYWAQAIFFRKPDGTPWVKFTEGSYPVFSPVIEVGKVLKWTGREEQAKGGFKQFTQYIVWYNGDNQLSGDIDVSHTPLDIDINHGGAVSFTCATQAVPAITWSAWFVTPGKSPLGDPP